MFQTDQPITKCSEDKLGRVSFAESLAQAILSYKSEECIVLGLFGSWGSGKTSLINMCLECINKSVDSYLKKEKPIVIKFNPWNYSGQQQLIVQFFNHLSSALSKHQSKRIKKIAKKIDTYIFSIISSVNIGINIGRISLDVKKAEKLINEKPLESQKEELSKLLRNQSHKIIVVIDDIDRLNNYEIRQIFQLIKVLGNLPNIIYLVAFDKNIVIKALEKEQEGSGFEYLEKIVQVPFEIPPVPKEEVYRLLFSQLDELIKDIPEERWEQTYWGNIFHSGIKVFFNTIRDVTRYLNTLRFSFPMVKEEVNPIDFIAITSFQVFLPELYYAIRDNKDLFTGANLDFEVRSEQERKLCNEILNLAPEDIRENIKELLTRLFPKLESIWENTNYDSNWLGIWRRDCRICSPDIFDIYFRLTIPKGELSQREIQAILSLANDPNSFADALLRLNEDGRIIRFLERLEDYTRDYIPEENIETIISVLMDIGDLFPEGESGFFEIDTPMRIWRICYQLSQRLDTHEKRFNLFKNAMEKAKRSLFTIVHEVSVQEQQHGKYSSKDTPTPEEKRTVNAEQLKVLEEIALNKIEIWANDGRLKKHEKLDYILLRWRKWGGGNKMNRFVENMIKSEEGLIDFITAFLTKIKSHTERDYVYETRWRIDIKNIEKFIEAKKIESRIRKIINSKKYKQLNKRQKIALKTFIDTIDGKIKDRF